MNRSYFLRISLVLIFSAQLGSCASLVSSATSGMADNLNAAILNQNDPETVRDGAPAFLLMLDSFVEGSPNDSTMLMAAAQLYAAYGIVFVDDEARSKRMTARSLGYGIRALCVDNAMACDITGQNFEAFEQMAAQLKANDVPAVFTLGVSWLAYIRAHREDWSALAELPNAQVLLQRVSALNPDYRRAEVARYLGIMNTLRPPALGGKFDEGRAHFEQAIVWSDGLDLGIKVDFAEYYARTLYDRELHDRLLSEVLQTPAEQKGLTLMNTIAQRKAADLLASGDDYF